jgi:thiol-disulfide isomerase/thioredoxin
MNSATNNIKQTATSIFQRSAGFFKDNWLVIVASLAMIGLGYYVYSKYIGNSTTYNANREKDSSNSDSNKVATMMLFYVDWCPHCKTAKPEWENLKSEYEGKQINGYTIAFTEYNCTTESPETDELMNRYKIEGYPTIKLIKDNQVVEYDAKPTKSTMEQFLHTVL